MTGRSKTAGVGRRLAILAAILSGPSAFYAAFVAPRVRTWGVTKTEVARAWAGDELVPDPAFVWTNAVTVARPPSEVWPWLTQLGQGRGGLYSYDWLENAVMADVHSRSEVVPELQGPLDIGERVIRMARYAPHNPVAMYDAGHALVLGGVADSPEQLRAGSPSSSWAFLVEPTNDRQSRLVIRSRGRGLAARLQGPLQFVMQRKMMLGIKHRAEGTWAPSSADVLVPLSWFAAAAATAVHGGRALKGRPGWRAAAFMASISAVGVQVLLFWDLPPRWRAGLVVVLVALNRPLVPGVACSPMARWRPTSGRDTSGELRPSAVVTLGWAVAVSRWRRLRKQVVAAG